MASARYLPGNATLWKARARTRAAMAPTTLRVQVLFAEPRLVALPTAHPLASRDRIPFRDLWDEPFVAAPAKTGRCRDYWLATDERGGHPVRIGAVADRPDDW